LLLLVLLALVAALARAEEWHEAYRNGVNALARGQGARAVELLERAAAQRPQPGRNVITYGTNVEERYYPYLRLAEAHLLLRNLEGARAALKRSESWGGPPARETRPEREAPTEGACSLEVVSHPAGADVYLDDELIGATDPEWGRLVRNGVPPGRHRIRLALAGHQDLTEEVELGAGGLTDFRRR